MPRYIPMTRWLVLAALAASACTAAPDAAPPDHEAYAVEADAGLEASEVDLGGHSQALGAASFVAELGAGTPRSTAWGSSKAYFAYLNTSTACPVAIEEVDLSNATKRTLLSGCVSVSSLAVDGSHLYFVELGSIGGIGTHTIKRIAIAGAVTPPQTVLAGRNPNQIFLEGDSIFFVERGRIYKARKDGTGSTLMAPTNVGALHGVLPGSLLSLGALVYTTGSISPATGIHDGELFTLRTDGTDSKLLGRVPRDIAYGETSALAVPTLPRFSFDATYFYFTNRASAIMRFERATGVKKSFTSSVTGIAATPANLFLGEKVSSGGYQFARTPPGASFGTRSLVRGPTSDVAYNQPFVMTESLGAIRNLYWLETTISTNKTRIYRANLAWNE